jgi:hypothetical protein
MFTYDLDTGYGVARPDYRATVAGSPHVLPVYRADYGKRLGWRVVAPVGEGGRLLVLTARTLRDLRDRASDYGIRIARTGKVGA